MPSTFEAGPPPTERRCLNCGTPARDDDAYCSKCGRALAPAGVVGATPPFCRQCGAALAPSQAFCTQCGSPVAADFAASGPYPLRYDVLYPEKLSRLLIFVKWLLAIPHFIVVWALGYATAAITVVAFFAILFTRRYPRGLFNLVVGINRWGANVTAYTYLFRDEYPPFSLDAGRYPVDYDVEYPERLSRWWIWVKWLVVIPHQIVISLLSIVGFFFAFLAWFAILFTGRYPRTFFNFNVGLQRWILRVGAYTQLLRDEFPPYSKRADAGPGSRRAIILSALFGIIGAATIAGLYIALLFAFSPDTEVVEVRYERLLDGQPTEPVKVQGTVVVLELVTDPYELDLASSGERFVAFDVSVTNESGLFAFVDVESFEMEDFSGNEHDPEEVFLFGFADDYVLEDGEEALATVVFEIDEDEDPASLTYAPFGVIAFGPWGDAVRFEFQ